MCGDELTGADIMMSFPLETARSRMQGDAHYPSIERYVAAIHARPAYRRALEVGGPYAFS